MRVEYLPLDVRPTTRSTLSKNYPISPGTSFVMDTCNTRGLAGWLIGGVPEGGAQCMAFICTKIGKYEQDLSS